MIYEKVGLYNILDGVFGYAKWLIVKTSFF